MNKSLSLSNVHIVRQGQMRIESIIPQSGKNMFFGESPTWTYVFCGFAFSILLGLFFLYANAHASELSYRPYNIFRLKVAILSAIGTGLSSTFLLWISVGVWRFYRRNRSVAGKVILALGVLHLPVTGLTVISHCWSFVEACYLILRSQF